MTKDFKVLVQVWNTQCLTERKAIHSALFWPKSTNLTLKSAKYQNLQTFVTKIFKFKTGLSPDLMTDIFKFIENSYSLQKNSQFRWSKRQNMSHKKEKYSIIFFQMNMTLSSAIIFIIFWDFLMFYRISLLPQVKPCTVITYKRAIYELPHKLPNDWRFISEVSKFHAMIA